MAITKTKKTRKKRTWLQRTNATWDCPAPANYGEREFGRLIYISRAKCIRCGVVAEMTATTRYKFTEHILIEHGWVDLSHKGIEWACPTCAPLVLAEHESETQRIARETVLVPVLSYEHTMYHLAKYENLVPCDRTLCDARTVDLWLWHDHRAMCPACRSIKDLWGYDFYEYDRIGINIAARTDQDEE